MKLTREIKTAILVIASILLFIWGYSFLKGKDLFTDYKTLYAEYDNVEDLSASAPVTINGLTIGKVTNLKGASKRPGIDYSFNVSGKKVFSDSPVSINSIKEGEFYKVVYSSKNPEICRIYLDEKITDTALILKAGFSKEDIANMPK